MNSKTAMQQRVKLSFKGDIVFLSQIRSNVFEIDLVVQQKSCIRETWLKSGDFGRHKSMEFSIRDYYN